MIKKETKIKKEKSDCCPTKNKCHSNNSSAIYGLGIFGALFYFLKGAVTFTAVIVGIFKSIFWPAFVLFRCLELLGI
jgi:hypothetical protein